MKLTYVIGEDKRNLVDDIQNFQIDFAKNSSKWVQARQYENSMRQVFADIQNEDHSPFDLTGCNVVFEGLLPDKTSRIYDAKDGVILDPLAGQFRFDMPKQAFAVAGSYVQAFFRIMRDGDNVATLEFDMTVLADKVISGLIPADYITPFEDLYVQLEAILKNAGDNLQALLAEWTKKFSDEFDVVTAQLATFKTDSQALLNEWRQKFSDAVDEWNGNYAELVAAKNALTEQFNTLQEQIKANDLVTTAMLATTTLNDLKLAVDIAGLPFNTAPQFKAYAYHNGFGIAQTTAYYGTPKVSELTLTVTLVDGSATLLPAFKQTELDQLVPDFATNSFTVNRSTTSKWRYLISGTATIGIYCVNTTFKMED